MAAEIVAPVSIAHIRCGRSEIRLEGKSGECDEGVAGESDLITVAAKTSPTMEYDGATIGTGLLHVVEEYMVAPECLAEPVDAVIGELLLPVEPPEVYTLAFERADYIFEECFLEGLVFELPGDAFSGCRIDVEIGANGGVLILGRVDTIGGVQIEGGAESGFMDVVQ